MNTIRHFNTTGLEQLAGYLEKKNLNTGYLITFQFLKEGERVKTQGYKEINGKRIFEAVV